MSWSLWTFIEYKDIETNSWKQLLLYKKQGDKYNPVEIEIGNADYTFMDYVFEDSDYHYRSLPSDLSPTVRDFFYKKDEDNHNFLDWGADTAWFDFIELGLLAKSNELMVDDINNEDNGIWDDKQDKYIYPQVNPLKEWYQKVAAYINFADDFWNIVPGEIRVIITRAR